MTDFFRFPHTPHIAWMGEGVPRDDKLLSSTEVATLLAGEVMVDENAYTGSELASLKNLVATVFRIEHPADPESIQALLRLLEEWLVDRPDLQRMIARWMRATLMRKPEYRILLPEVDNL